MRTERRLALVLGAGGAVGLAYHAGALRALHKVAGVDPAGADLIVGTSAGSVIGARLRKGWTTEDLWGVATSPADPDGRREVFPPAWSSPLEMAQRLVGSAYVMTRLMVPVPLLAPPAPLRRQFPGGMFDSELWARRLATELGTDWPDQALWVCAADLDRRRRVVFGREGAPPISLARAVLASCAVPGVYAPVRAAGMTLVDGGAISTTHLDLAAGYDLVIGVVPMAFDTELPPDRRVRLLRQLPSRWLAAETRAARRAGSEVLLVRPSAPELVHHRGNPLRGEAGGAIATAAYDATARLVETPRFREARQRLV